MTTESHIRVPIQAVEIEKIQILKGTEETCESILALPRVTVQVGNIVCVSKFFIPLQ